MKKIHWTFICAGLLASPTWAQVPQNLKHDFEDTGKLAFQMVPGKASPNSTIQLSEEKAHSGRKAIKVHYEFTGAGYLQFLTPSPVALSTGSSVTISAWIYGTGLHAFDGAAIRFIDTHGETFQYRLNESVTDALNGNGWTQVKVTLDLTKPNGHWGDNSDGVADLPMKFLGFAFDRTAAEPVAGSVYLDDLAFEMANPTVVAANAPAATAPVGNLKLSLQPVWNQTKTSIFIYAPGTQVPLQANLAGAPATGKLTWTARDFDNGVVAQGEIPLKENIEWSLPAGKPGILYVTAEAKDAAGNLLASTDTRVAFAPVATTPTPSQPLIWGVNSHPEHGTLDDVEREAALTSALGFTAMRGGVGTWLQVQPDNANQWQWDKSDKLMQILVRNNIKLLHIFLGTPRWATSADPNAAAEWQDWSYKLPRDMANLTAYSRAVAQRYNDNIIAYEIWNEPDISFWRGTPDEYVKLYETSQAAIKSVVPKARVMNGGFSETKRQPDFIPHFAKTTTQKPDIFAYHTHMQFSNLVKAGDDVKGYLSGAKWEKTPVWLNEAGYSSSGRLTERDQASALIKKYAYSAALGYEAYFWYDLRNDGNDATDLEHNFGLVRRDFTPKAAAVAARTLTSQIGGKRFVRRLDAPNGIYALLFEGKNGAGQPESTIVVWNESTSGSQVPLFWKLPAAGNRITAMGTQSPLNVQGGVGVTTASPMPEFVTVRGAATNIGLVPNILDFDGSVLASSGRSEKWKLVLANPLTQTFQGQLKLSAQDGWKVDQNSINFSLAPNAKKEFTVSVTAPEAATTSSMKLEIISPSLPTRIEAITRLLPSLSIPRLASRGTPGDFTRWDKPTVHLGVGNTVSLFEATPMQELHFHGDTDMSADVNVVRVPEGLLLSVRAEDNTHNQKEDAGSEWRGDSLQFALSLPTGENYEWMAALNEKGPSLRLMSAPSGIATGPQTSQFTIRREGTKTLYEVLIPSKLPGQNVVLPDHFSFSLLVNDNDGAGRKGWIEWTPGIGLSKDPTQFQPMSVY
ncbi:hypothetical protein EON83_27925 [bacterium]|nr:MAG: hypothetical protein EON83_27925 [bacterium]